MDYLRYYIVNLVVGAAVAGLALGGNWFWLGIGTFPVLLALDVMLPADYRKRHIRSGLLADLPLYLHLPLMATLWWLFLSRLGGSATEEVLTSSQVIGMVLSVGWVGAVPTLPIAHELMHRRHWFPRWVAKIYSTVYLDPNRDMGHILTHHIDLDTAADSDTPRRGQSIYAFVWQASYGSWRDSVMISVRSLRKRGLSLWSPRNSLYVTIGLLGALFGAVFFSAGERGVVVALSAMVSSKILVEGFNYLQHYGMVRVPGAPIQLHHAWNHLGAIIRPLGVEITNHINHHFDSRWKFHELEPRPDGAQMPSAFVCFVCALIPPLWFSLIAKPRLKHWDEHFASPEEKCLAMEENRKAGWPQWVAV